MSKNLSTIGVHLTVALALSLPTTAQAQKGTTPKQGASKATAKPPQSPVQLLYFRAVSAAQKKNYAEAERLYKELLRLEPRATLGWANLGLLFGEQGRIPQAMTCFAKATELEPKVPMFWMHLAACQFSLGSIKDAEASIKKAVALDPKNRDALALLADVLTKQQKYAEAVEPLRTLRSQDGTKINDTTELALIVALERSSKTADALTLARKRAVRKPKDINSHLIHGDMARLAGDLDEAQKAYETVLKLDPKNPDAPQALTLIAGLKGDMEAGIRHVQARLKQTPNDPRLHFQWGYLIYSDMRKPEVARMVEAAKHFQRACTLDPKNSLYLTYHGLSLLLQGPQQYRSAEGLLKGAVSLDAGNTMARLALAQIYERSNRVELAVTEYQTVLKASPDNRDARRGLAGTLYVVGKKAEAYREMQEIATQNPKETRVLAELGSWQVADDDIAGAEKTYAALLQRDPKDTGAWIAQGTIYQRTLRKEPAQKSYEQALIVDPKNETAALLLGDLFQEQGKKDEAVVIYRHLLETAPTNNKVRWQLILTLRDQKRYEDALTETRKLTLQRNDPQVVLYQLMVPALLTDLQRSDEAITELQRLRQENPNEDSFRYALATVYEKGGHPIQAEKILMEMATRTAVRPEDTLAGNIALAEFYERTERWDEAGKSYEDALRLNPLSAPATAGLVRVRTKQGKPDQPVEFLESIALADPERPNESATQAVLQIYRLNSAVLKLQSFTERLLAKYPNERSALYARAYATTLNAPNETTRTEAIALLKKIVEKNPLDAEAQYLLAVQYEMLGKKEEAITTYKAVLLLTPRNKEVQAALKRLGSG